MDIFRRFISYALPVTAALIPMTAQAQCFPFSCICSGPEDWYDVAYIAPKIYHEELRFSHREADFFGLDLGKDLTGICYGVDAGYAYRHALCGLYAELYVSYGGGKLEENGVPHRMIHDFNGEGYIGWNFRWRGWDVTPYVGIGYGFHKQRFETDFILNFNDDDDDDDDDEHSLKMRYHTFYVPCGINFNYVFTDCFEMGVKFKVMPQVDSYIKTNLSENLRFSLSNSIGYEVDVPFTFNYYYCDYIWKLSFIPYWSMTEYGSSNRVERDFSSGQIPRHTVTDGGVKIEAGALF